MKPIDSTGNLGKVRTRSHPCLGSEAPTTEKYTVVFDTSVLIADPAAMVRYEHVDVVVPLVVVEELDGLKTRTDHVGQAAREALRAIEDLRVANNGDLRVPVRLTGTSTFRIELGEMDRTSLVNIGLDRPTNDNRILAMCANLNRATPPVRLLSNDTALRIKAAHIGVEVAPHVRGLERSRSVGLDSWPVLDVSDDLLEEAVAIGITVDDLVNDFEAVPGGHSEAGNVVQLPHPGAIRELAETSSSVVVRGLQPNDFAVLQGSLDSVLVRRSFDGLTPLNPDLEAYGLKPRSREQLGALTLLLDPEVTVVALDGVAGTGKTLLALAAGLEQVVERKPRYERLAIYRPIVAVGHAELGFLPGSLDEKLEPWMAAVVDAMTALTEDRSFVSAQNVIDELLHRGRLTMESVTFLRGRTLQSSFIVVDEAQNLEPATVKTILTRVGADAKIVFCGDSDQIDAPYLSKHNNGLAVLMEAFKGQPCFGGVRLTQCERSAVASLAAQLM